MTEPMGSAPATSFLDSLGDRSRRRAEPRASIAIAGAGCALAVVGALVVAGDTGATDGDFNRVPGIILSALIVAAGLVTLAAIRQGPVATAGAVAAALGVPPLMFFVTFDMNSFPPYSTDAILIVSTVAWLAAYTVGPARGRPFFLSAGLIGFWFTLMQVIENVFEAPFGLFGMGMGSSEMFSPTQTLQFDPVPPISDGLGDSGSFDSGSFDSGSFDSGSFDAPNPILPDGPSFDLPDPTTIGFICLGLGIAYLLMSRWLDGRGHHGTATPFAVAALPTLFASPIFLADDLETAGTGLLLLLIGAALAYQGATAGRRATAWFGGAATAIGALVFISDMTDDATVGGMLLMAAGIALVAIGHVTALVLSEPDEMALTLVGASAPSATGADAPPPSPAPPTANVADDDSHWAPPTDPPPDPPLPGSAPPPT
ncbi:MAG: hypothetical protein ACT452_12260 [Microthrixaceae bacterium]